MLIVKFGGSFKIELLEYFMVPELQIENKLYIKNSVPEFCVPCPTLQSINVSSRIWNATGQLTGVVVATSRIKTHENNAKEEGRNIKTTHATECVCAVPKCSMKYDDKIMIKSMFLVNLPSGEKHRQRRRQIETQIPNRRSHLPSNSHSQAEGIK